MNGKNVMPNTIHLKLIPRKSLLEVKFNNCYRQSHTKKDEIKLIYHIIHNDGFY